MRPRHADVWKLLGIVVVLSSMCATFGAAVILWALLT